MCVMHDFYLLVHAIESIYASHTQITFISSEHYSFQCKCRSDSYSATSMDYPMTEWNFIEKLLLLLKRDNIMMTE